MTVENAVGPNPSGRWVQPQIGLVPMDPGFSFTLMPIGCSVHSVEIRRLLSGWRSLAAAMITNTSVDVSENLLIPC